MLKKIVGLAAATAVGLGWGLSALAAPTGTAVLNSSSVQNASIHPGQTNTFTAAIYSSGGPANVLVDLELQDWQGHKVAQQYWDNQTIGAPALYHLTTPVMTLPGTYHFSVGLFNPGWAGQIAWYQAAQKFDVINTSLNSIGLTGATLSPVSDHSCPNLTAWLTNSSVDTQTILVDIELYDSSNKQIYQQFWDHYPVFSGGGNTATTACPLTLPAGTYYYSVGLFTSNPYGWTPFQWHHAVQKFTIGL